jgi:tRNA threonylcarbamoyl adenosine modification protein YeaZ
VILSVDTSLAILSIAILRDDGSLVGAVSMEGSGSRNEKLLPSIDFLLRENSIDRKDLTLLVSTRGPGSFTGVRIGLATLQGLSLSLGIPMRAFTTHEAVAEGFDGEVTVIGEAGRDEIYATDFRDRAPIGEPQLRPRSSASSSSIDLEREMHRVNVAMLAARRALRLRGEGVLEQFSDPTPAYVRLAEAEVKLLAKEAGSSADG